MTEGVNPRIAVLFIHGVEVNDPRYATGAIARLKRSFAKAAGDTPGAEEALVIEPAFWVPAVDKHETKLLKATFDEDSIWFYDALDWLVARVDEGSWWPILPLAASSLLRRLPGIGKMNFPTLRWVMSFFGGDAIAYQVTEHDRHVYDAIHHHVASALHTLSKKAGPEALLCVISHSIGTVIISDHVWDQQRNLPTRARADTPLERCETLAHLYTLGSPIALWTLRHEGFGEPISFPPPTLSSYHPSATSEWTNFYDPDDIVGYPLKGLNPEYDKTVNEDKAVSVGPRLIRNTPIAHPWYWNNDSVMGPIGASLAATWKTLKIDGQEATTPRPHRPRSTQKARHSKLESSSK